MKYSKELHDRVRQNLRMFDYPRFDDGDIDTLLDEIERLQAERRWIPVSERLPEEGAPVLSYENGIVFHDEYYPPINEWECACMPSHWMPLPEPPESEG